MIYLKTNLVHMLSTSTHHIWHKYSHIYKQIFRQLQDQLHPPMVNPSTDNHKIPRYQLATTLNSVSGGSKTFNGMACNKRRFVVRRLSGEGGGWLKGMVVKRFAELPEFTVRFMIHECTMLFFWLQNHWKHRMLLEQHNIQNTQCTHVEDSCDCFVG